MRSKIFLLHAGDPRLAGENTILCFSVTRTKEGKFEYEIETTGTEEENYFFPLGFLKTVTRDEIKAAIKKEGGIKSRG